MALLFIANHRRFQCLSETVKPPQLPSWYLNLDKSKSGPVPVRRVCWLGLAEGLVG